MGALVIAARYGLSGQPDRVPQPPAETAMTFKPLSFDSARFAPLRLAGAWAVTATEPRFGGVSGLAVAPDGLVALTDSGVVVRFERPRAGPRPGQAMASFRDLPDGPGEALRKAGRDSEALVRDAAGRGWWVAFENRHAAFLFDTNFERVIERIDLRDHGWSPNKGAEGAVSRADGLWLVGEGGVAMVRAAPVGGQRVALGGGHGRLSDAALLPDGRIVMVARNVGPRGFSAHLLVTGMDGGLTPLVRLPLGRLDNVEALAAERLPGGGIRLWLMTDNDYRRRVPTLLVALDWASPVGPGR